MASYSRSIWYKIGLMIFKISGDRAWISMLVAVNCPSLSPSSTWNMLLKILILSDSYSCYWVFVFGFGLFFSFFSIFFLPLGDLYKIDYVFLV